MSQDFKLKFDEYQENNPTDKDGEQNPDYYSSPGNVRNLAFVWPDGKMQFFNYSYLVTCTIDKDNGSIQLEFSTHCVVIKGYRLEQLFYDIMNQFSKLIRCSEKRYTHLHSPTKFLIHEIAITKIAT